ncbi:MAG: hypothetical protein H6711_34700, partial [Myxococcales bacterium]|nr:hypothetical protein [Myxococcales bacterium]
MPPAPPHPSWTAAGEDEGPATPQELQRELGTASTLVRPGSFGGAETLSAGDRPGVSEAMPTRIGRYVILGQLGKGGMGVVYAAYDPELDRRVAIKLLLTGEGGPLGARLLREAQALARLSHPNVVQVY